MDKIVAFFVASFLAFGAHAQTLTTLPQATLPLTGNEATYIVQGGLPRQTPVNSVASLAPAAPAVPTVATVSALRAYSSGSPAVWPAVINTSGYATPGDGGNAAYQWSSASTAPDDGCVYIKPTTAGTGRYVMEIPAPGMSIRSCGVKADGVTDDTAALQTAANSLASVGGGNLLIPPAQILINSANLTLPSHIAIVGKATSEGFQQNNTFSSAPYTLLLNPGYSIKLGWNTGMKGLNVVASTLAAPTTLRGEITAANNFSGTALSCSGVADVDIEHVFIIGFKLALQVGSPANCDRLHASSVRGDTTNGVQVSSCYDTCNFDVIEFWPFLGSPYVTTQFQVSNISGVTNSGGLIKVSLGAVPPTPIITGDIVVLGGVGGVPANGRWTVTAIDMQSFTLQGSTFSGSYTSGGTVLLNGTMRHGTGFDIENAGGGPVIYALTTYGYDVGIHYGSGTISAYCTDCWLDTYISSAGHDPGVTAILQDTGAYGNFFSGFAVSSGPALLNNTTAGDLHVSHARLFALGWAAVGANGWPANAVSGYSIQNNNGTLYFDDSVIETTNGEQPQFYVATASYITSIIGFSNAGAVFQATTDCPKLTYNNSTLVCSWTPIFAGATTPGTATYYTQVGGYVLTGQTVNLWGHVTLSSLSGATGNAVIENLPLTPGAELGDYDGPTCSISRASYFTLGVGYTQLALAGASGATTLGINQIGSNAIVANTNSATQVGGTAELQFSCVFHR